MSAQMLIAMSWAAYSSTSSLSRSVQEWLAESSGTKVVSMSMFSFISLIPPFVPLAPGDIADFHGTGKSLDHKRVRCKSVFTS
ncbi:protein TrkB involved in potassium or sodium transport [Bifidobacterium adolescentis ATCC 15703]|uniref:Protein TrkB involved in potassium or sodium transport n=1 Tax=Bifidobacterium adolescentis (strain ATCC 15703 / DSM 20083 / NCTC 11814 / E194a) TaxID=367928 RepID=A1A1P4_BIFAA|nr:protein TrkB involved in potassium or sodium transport [Bifidobacterium adolescentis ATCC 15703]